MFKKETLRKFIINEFLSDTSGEEIGNDMDLIATGIIDSLAVLKIISFIEMTNDIAIDPDELDPEKLNSIDAIYNLIESKISQVA